jgi:hypothetical protein
MMFDYEDEASRMQVWRVSLWGWRITVSILGILLLYFTFTSNIEGMGATIMLLIFFAGWGGGPTKPNSANTVSSWTGIIKGEMDRSDNPSETFSGIIHRLLDGTRVKRYEMRMILESFTDREDEVGRKAREILSSLEKSEVHPKHPLNRLLDES